jgi:hypothetical protein
MRSVSRIPGHPPFTWNQRCDPICWVLVVHPVARGQTFYCQYLVSVPGVKRLELEVYCSYLYNVEVNISCMSSSTPRYILMALCFSKIKLISTHNNTVPSTMQLFLFSPSHSLSQYVSAPTGHHRVS